MGEPLKNQFGPEIPGKIARMISAVHPVFDADVFLSDALDGYETLELMARARKIAQALHRHLPEDFPAAIEILLDSLGPKLPTTESFGMAPFLYLPHVCFVAEYGLDHFEPSMRAQYELTQRFSAEFSIRAFLERFPEATLARLKLWASDPSPHVRRLVSEGTRPRLPWAARLRAFQEDPRPVLALLELLKDDPEPYVRRSVANNLNDIGKDHPALLAETARRWMEGADDERRKLIHHALRSAVKRGEPGALAVLGFADAAKVQVSKVSITPRNPRIGEQVTISFELCNTSGLPQRVNADFRIHFVKANGKTRPKVFKLQAVALGPAQAVQLRKVVRLHNMTTRRHYTGTHKVDALLNGSALPLGAFEISER